jgi:poly-gamma-glutamate synthesis protein (capsule biosynthesis protein)
MGRFEMRGVRCYVHALYFGEPMMAEQKQSRIALLLLVLAALAMSVLGASFATGIVAGPEDEDVATPLPSPTPTPAPPAVSPTPSPSPIEAPSPTPPPVEAPAGLVSLRVTAIGDVNFNRNRVPVLPQGAQVWDTLVPFASFTARLAPLVDGDVNYANIEAVITDRNDFDPPDPDKAFCFRTHPNAIRELLRARFNLFGLANNHAFDFGATGVRETLKFMRAFAETNPIAFTGIGMDFAEASRPAIFTVKGVRVGLVAVGIGASAGPSSAGVASVADYRRALVRLRDAEVDLRVFSIHDGKEGTLVPNHRQLRMCREAIRDFKVNIVLGHHPHRVQGVELYGNGVIFYSLGNGLMRGAADIGDNPATRYRSDFGLMARINLVVDQASHRVTLRRIEAVPLYKMHEQPQPSSPDAAAARLQTLNELSAYHSLQQGWNSSCPPPTRNEPVHFAVRDYFGYMDL